MKIKSNELNINRINKFFSETLLNWYDQHGRKTLPWQQPQTPYRVWLSEIMLQQTQVQTVIPYFQKFVARFPDIRSLANASIDDVLTLWAGLGYYSRARNLHRCAHIITHQYAGHFPEDLTVLQSLPGIGHSTAAAIMSLAFNQPTAILDGNVKRVLSRFFLIHHDSPADLVQHLWQQARACMPTNHCREYTQAIMDMGATCCTRKFPRCQQCPLKNNCQAFQHQKVHEYPAAKPKPSRPIRSQQLFIFYSKNDLIYLEKRPEKGIWGGLWCFPLHEETTSSADFLNPYQLATDSLIQPWIILKHTLTHLQLELQTYLILTDENAAYPGQWVPIHSTDTLGLPKPIKTILYQLRAASDSPIRVNAS